LSSEEETLKKVGDIVRSGAAGIVFGRSVFQAPDMPAFLSRLRAALREQPAADWFRSAVEVQG
jgi:DhnA family fructose-bisphosphate aldolase class Ia